MNQYFNLSLLLLLTLTVAKVLTVSKGGDVTGKQQDDETVVLVLPDKEELPEDPMTECVESNYWTCVIVQKRPVSKQTALDIQQNQHLENGYTQIRGLQMYFFNKMSRENGSGWHNRLYVSGKIYWTFHPWKKDSQVYSLNVLIGPLAGPQVLYLLELRRPKRLPQGVEHQQSIYVNEIKAHEWNQLNNDRSVALQTVYSASTTLDVPQLYASNDASSCISNASGPEVVQRKKMASKWTGALDALNFHRFDSKMSVRFFGAPPSYCIEQYKVVVYLQDAIPVASKIVKQKDLKRNADGVLIGQTAFFELRRGERYKVKILPDEKSSSGECVCAFDGRCGCVRIHSQFFTPPSLPAMQDWIPQQNSSIPTSHIPASKDLSTLLYLVMALALFLLTLVLLSLALLLRLLRHSSMDSKRNLLLVFSGKKSIFNGNHPSASSGSSDSTSDSRKPLLKKCRSVVLVSGEQGTNTVQLEVLARMLQALGIHVYYCRWEQQKLEENMQLWVHTVLSLVDKIFMFHGPRGNWLLSKEGRNNVVERDIFDDVFHCLHSSLVYSDPRIIHLKWTVNQQPMFFSPEIMYLLPRDLGHIFTAIKLHLSAAQVRDYQEEFCRVSSTTPGELASITIPRKEEEQSNPFAEQQQSQLTAYVGGNGGTTLECITHPETIREECEVRVKIPATTCLEVESRHLTMGDERTRLRGEDVPSNDSGIVV